MQRLYIYLGYEFRLDPVCGPGPPPLVRHSRGVDEERHDPFYYDWVIARRGCRWYFRHGEILSEWYMDPFTGRITRPCSNLMSETTWRDVRAKVVFT